MSNTLTDDRRHVWHPFTQMQTAPEPLAIASGRGAVLTTEGGDELIDLISSWWVTTHGHSHPQIVAAISEQAARLEQVIFAGCTHAPAAELAAALSARLPGDLERVFFSDDGSTAVEVALKMASQYWLNRGEERSRILAFEGGYHGDTVGAMSVGCSTGFFDAYRGLMFAVDTLPFPATWEGDEDVEAKEAEALACLDGWLERHAGQIAALIVEPLVQGAGGMRMCRAGFLRTLAARLEQAGVLLILDEVMTGFGRTGALFACERAGVVPDMICLSKGLSGGFLPISVTVCRAQIYDAFLDESFARALVHGHSFTANPIACAAANASLRLFEEEQTLARLPGIEALHRERLTHTARLPAAGHGRVTGTIAALDVMGAEAAYDSTTSPRLRAFFQSRGLLIRPLGNVIYLMPPYCITDAQLHRAWDGIDEALAGLGDGD